MIPIAMPTSNRPHYLRRVLDHLKAQNPSPDEWMIVAQNEPSRGVDAILETVDWLPLESITNKRRLGMAHNVCTCIDRAAALNDWFMVLEDDFLIGGDSLKLAKWSAQYITPRNDLAWFSLYSRDQEQCKVIEREALRTNGWFCCRVWGGKSAVWQRFRESFDCRIMPRNSWACPFNLWLHEQRLGGIHPTFSRVQYIGLCGVHGRWAYEEARVSRWLEEPCEVLPYQVEHSEMDFSLNEELRFVQGMYGRTFTARNQPA